MKKILLDTCTILTTLKFKIDLKLELIRIFDEKFKVLYIDKTIDELKTKPLGKLAIQILNNLDSKRIITKENKNVDSLIIRYIEKHPETLVATQDKALKEKLKKRNIRLVTIRQKRYLKIIN